MDTIFWSVLLVVWLALYAPDMLEWWRTRGIQRQDLEELRSIRCVEDMFKEKQ